GTRIDSVSIRVDSMAAERVFCRDLHLSFFIFLTLSNPKHLFLRLSQFLPLFSNPNLTSLHPLPSFLHQSLKFIWSFSPFLASSSHHFPSPSHRSSPFFPIV
ncbi:hypothetical protein PIB30_085282, partial [Stylosanthes scabra]|nr:hypothetical protein [Stylosanthes scabra]